MDVVITVAAFKDLLVARGYAANTIVTYRKGLDQFQKYLEDRSLTDLRQITAGVMAEYRESVMAESIAMESKALKIRPVKRLFEYLADNHQLLVNPAEGLVETCRKGRKIGPTLAIAEMELLLAQPDLATPIGIRNRAVLELFYATGIRLNELVNVEVQDVDLNGNMLVVRCGKGKADRTVPLGKNAGGLLKRYVTEVRPLHARDPEVKALFVNLSGHPLAVGSIRSFLAQYRKAAGIEKPISPHTFRRTCATHLLQQGADIRYIQELLGHKCMVTTQVYTKVMPVEVKRTHEKTHPGGGIIRSEGL